MRERRRRVTRDEVDLALREVFPAKTAAFDATWRAMQEALARPGEAPDYEKAAALAAEIHEVKDDLVLEVVPKGSATVEVFTVFDVVVGRPSTSKVRRPVLAIREGSGVVDLHVPPELLAQWALVRLRDGHGVYGFGEPIGAAMGPDDEDPEVGPLPGLSAELPSETVLRLRGRASVGSADGTRGVKK